MARLSGALRPSSQRFKSWPLRSLRGRQPVSYPWQLNAVDALHEVRYAATCRAGPRPGDIMRMSEHLHELRSGARAQASMHLA